jgi:DNA polymerase III delta subunit
MAKARSAPPAAAKPARIDSATSVVLLHGGDEFAIAERAREALRELADGKSLDDALETIDARADSGDGVSSAVGRALSALFTVGLFSSFKIIWLRDVNWLPEKAMSKWDEVETATERLQAALRQGLPADTHLLITSEAVSKRSGFLKACEERGVVIEYALSTTPWDLEREMPGRVAAMLRERRIECEDDLPAKIVERLGYDPRLLHAEVEKLDVYLGDRRELDEEDVQLMVPLLRERTPWELADAVAQRNLSKSLRLLEQVLQQRMSEVLIITTLENRFRELGLMREALDRRALTVSGSGPFPKAHWHDETMRERVTSSFGGKTAKSPTQEARLAQAATAFRAAELGRARRLIVDTHEDLFRSALPKKQILELLILRLLAPDHPR